MILGGHGITAWGDDLASECEAQLARDHPHGGARSSPSTARPEPFGAVVAGFEPLPTAERRARAAALAPGHPRAWPRPTGRRSGHFTDSDVVLDFLAASASIRGWPRSARPAPTTSCAPRSGRWCSTCRRPRRSRTSIARLRELHAAYRDDYARLLRAPRRRPTARPMRGADPAIVLVPGVGMFCFGANKQTARVAGEFYVNAINVMRGAEAVSTYAPIAESGEVPDRVLGARGGQAAAAAQAEAARRPGSPS